jgi:drug/metabolite transporter (DMT)-like permease
MVLVNMQALSEGKTAWGLFCGLMAAVTYAVMLIFNRKATSIKGLENALWQLVGGFVTVAIFVGLRQGFAIELTGANLLPILILGVVNTGIGCWLYFSSLGRLPVQTVAICGYLEPLSALLFSAAFLGETLGPLQLGGAVLILSGAAFGEFMGQRPSHSAQHSEATSGPGCRDSIAAEAGLG